MLGVNSIAKRGVMQRYMHVRTSASVGYKRKFHKHWNADIFWLNLLRWTLSCLLLSPESTASLRGSTPTLCCSVPTASQLLCPANSLCCPAANCFSAPFSANSHPRPLTTSGYGEISGPRILCLVSRQNRQRNRLPWRETHIVLQKHIQHIQLISSITG